MALTSFLRRAADKIDELKIDFAYYNPVSLVLKEKGRLSDPSDLLIGIYY